MKTYLISMICLTLSLNALTLDEVIGSSLAKSPSLEVIKARLQANKGAIAASNQFTNPELSLTTNSLSAQEKMHQSVFTLKQKIQYYNKRDIKQGVAIAQETLLQEKLNDARVALVAEIKIEAYTIWELNQLLDVIDAYIRLTQKNIELYESYSSVDVNQHMGIMKAELSLSDLKIQKATLQSKITAAYARLSYLAARKIEHLDIALSIQSKPRLENLETSLANNSLVAIKRREIEREQAKVKEADINNYPDVNLLAGYAYRDNFDNYFNVGLSLSLPIYGTEDSLEEEARAKALAVVSEKEDVEIQVKSQLKSYYAQISSAYEIYHIVQDEALPQVAHMFEISNSSISTGGDLFKYIDVLFDKLALEQKSINAVSLYYKAKAKISQLKGEIR